MRRATGHWTCSSCLTNGLQLAQWPQDLMQEMMTRSPTFRLVTEEPIVESGWTWNVLADPDGNEFCILRALAPEELAS